MRPVGSVSALTGSAIKFCCSSGSVPLSLQLVTQAFADEIGADGYSEDAASAAELANKLKADWEKQ